MQTRRICDGLQLKQAGNNAPGGVADHIVLSELQAEAGLARAIDDD